MNNIKQTITKLYKNYWWLTPLTIFLLWRIALEIIGRLSLSITVPIENLWPADPNPPLWARWDSGWYSSIVTDGYNIQDNSFSNTAFFPLYPLLWKIFWAMTGLPRLITGVLISNITALTSVLVFYRWVQLKYNAITAQKSLSLWLVFPTSLFLISAYSESTFILLLALILLAAFKKKWLLASLLAALISATRPVGIVLWPWLLYCYWRQRDSAEEKINPWLLFIPPLGLMIFSLHLWQVTGDPLAWLHQQSLFQRTYQNPLELTVNYIYLLFVGGKYWLIHVGEVCSLIFSGWLLIRLFRQDLSLALLALALLMPSLFTGILTSFPRFILVVLPLFLTLAKVNNKYVAFGYYALASTLLIMAIFNFVTWRWVA